MIIKLLTGILITLVMSVGAVFGEDLDLAAIKKAIKDKGVSWTAGENAITKLSPEARRKLCGAISVPHTEPGITLTPPTTIPTTWDWRNVNGTNWTTPIRTQGDCGSCVAFGAIGALEPLVRIEKNNPTLDIDLSEQHLFSCGGGDCNVGMYSDAAANYLKYYGTPDEFCYPYKSGQGTNYSCSYTCPDWKNRAIRITNWSWVSNTPTNIQIALLQAPLSTTMDIYTDFYSYKSGVYEYATGTLDGGHQITLVGYNATEQYWICKNSWGTDWGENGWFRIRFGEAKIGKDTILMSGVILPEYPEDLNSVYVYPNPTNGKELYFTNLTKNVRIRIYTIAGEKVVDKEVKDEWEWKWDCRGSKGQKLASGIYIYLVTNDKNQKKTGKLGIVR